MSRTRWYRRSCSSVLIAACEFKAKEQTKLQNKRAKTKVNYNITKSKKNFDL